MMEFNWQPLDSLPWTDGNRLPRGIVLRHTFTAHNTPRTFDLLGDETSGRSDRGCGCCSDYWDNIIEPGGVYDAWAWVPGFEEEV